MSHTVPVAFDGPPQEWVSKRALRKFLGCTMKELDAYIADGIIMRPRVRKGRVEPAWTRKDAAWCKYRVEEHERFTEAESVQKK